jgi:hypothetical protein
LFPEADLALRDASWLSHLNADRGPIDELAESLRYCFIAEIERLGQDSTELVDNRFAEYIVILFISSLWAPFQMTCSSYSGRMRLCACVSTPCGSLEFSLNYQ